jgi:CheB methylesterase/CheW-like domain
MSLDPQKQALLDERARKLATRETNAAPRELFDRVTLVEVGREVYGLSLGHLREIARATPIAALPGLPSFILGVTAIRGELVSVVDLAELTRWSKPPGAASPFASKGCLGFVLVQHMVPGFIPGFAKWLAEESGHPVRLVTEACEPIAGVVYLNGGEQHLVVEPGPILRTNQEAPRSFHRPSIDVLFESAASSAAARFIGVVHGHGQ